MIEITFPDRKYKKLFPESLSECDSVEYRELSRLIYYYQNGKLSLEQFQVAGVYSLLGVIPSKKKLDEETQTAIFKNVSFLTDYLMNFFEFTENNGVKSISIKQDYIHNPIPNFRHKGIKYIGPADNFKDVTFGQYVDALGLFLDHAKYQEYDTMVEMLNLFYKPSVPLWKSKLTLQPKGLDVGIVNGFYLYFASFQKFLSSAVISVGGTDVDLGIIFSPTEGSVDKSELPGLGMKSMLFNISESGVFGTSEEVRKTNLWEVILRLYDIRKKALDEKAKYDRIENQKK